MKNSVVNIESVVNSSFGTGFVIHSDDRGVYVLTCQHVVDDVQKPVVENVLAKVIATGKFIDMAVLYVSKLHLKPLPLQIDECRSLEVDVIGFSHFSKSLNQKKHIKATLYKKSIELHSTDDDLFYTVRKIKADDGFNFDRGNSGSPVICKDSGKVIAMISNKEGDSIGYAIDIINLKEIWKDMPPNILEPTIEQVSGVMEDIKPKSDFKPQEPKSTPKKKSSIAKYIFLFLASGAIFLGTYIFISNSKHTKPNTPPVNVGDNGNNNSDNSNQNESKKEKYARAKKIEREAFEYLVKGNYKNAIASFKEADKIYHPFHKSLEIAELLSKNINSMSKFSTKRKVLLTIINDLSKYAPADLIKELKKQTELHINLPQKKPVVKPKDVNLTIIKPNRKLDIRKIELLDKNKVREVH